MLVWSRWGRGGGISDPARSGSSERPPRVPALRSRPCQPRARAESCVRSCHGITGTQPAPDPLHGQPITCWAALGLPWLPSTADAAPELSCPAWRRGVGCTSRGHAGRLHGRPAREGGSWYQEESGRFTREPDAVVSWSSRNASNFTYFLMHFTNLSKRKIVTKIPHFLGSYKTICI